MKPTKGKIQPATQVKVLSPEISNVRKADSIHKLEGGTPHFDMVRNALFSRGLSPWDGFERKLQELGRSDGFPRRGYPQTIEKGKDAEMTCRKSDYLIVAKKRGNARGAKGITLLCRGEGKNRPGAELE